MKKRFVPEGNPIIITPGGRQNNTAKRMLLGFGLMLLYGLVLGPVVRTLLPKGVSPMKGCRLLHEITSAIFLKHNLGCRFSMLSMP